MKNLLLIVAIYCIVLFSLIVYYIYRREMHDSHSHEFKRGLYYEKLLSDQWIQLRPPGGVSTLSKSQSIEYL